MTIKHAAIIFLCAAVFAGAMNGVATTQAAADDMQTFALTVKDHHFAPDHIFVPAGQRFRITVTNLDDTTDELESYDMKFEKIVVPQGKITVFAGPLHPGTYKYFDDYHPDLAKGTVTATGPKE